MLDEEHFSVDAVSTLGVGQSSESNPLFLGVFHDVVTNMSLSNRADWFGFVFSLASGTGTDGSVDLFVKSFEGRISNSLFPLRELLFEFLGVFFLQLLVVCFNVTTEDVFSVFLRVETGLCLFNLLGFTSLVGNEFGLGDVETGESLVLVGNVETSITSSFHGSENTVTSGGSDKTNIEACLEGTSLEFLVSSAEVSSINFILSFDHIVHLLVGK